MLPSACCAWNHPSGHSQKALLNYLEFNKSTKWGHRSPQHRSIRAGAVMPARAQGFAKPRRSENTHRRAMLHVQEGAGKVAFPLSPFGVWWDQLPLIHTAPKTTFQITVQKLVSILPLLSLQVNNIQLLSWSVLWGFAESYGRKKPKQQNNPLPLLSVGNILQKWLVTIYWSSGTEPCAFPSFAS